MKKHLRLTAVLVCLSLLFLLTGCQDSKAFSPSASSTWGELCKQFQPEWYKALPDEVSAQLDFLLLSENHSSALSEPDSSAIAAVYQEVEQSKDAGYTVLGMDNGELTSGDSTELMGMSLMLNEQDNAVDYMLSAYSSLETAPTEVCLVIALSDPESGTYQAAAASTVSVTNDVDGVAESFQKLKHDHLYKVQAIAIVAPSEGYQSSGPLYVEQEVTTIEPTTK